MRHKFLNHKSAFHRIEISFLARIIALIVVVTGFVHSYSQAASVIDEWNSVKPPAAPTLKPVSVDPKTTALIMGDLMTQNCGTRPRCISTIPAIKKLLANARAAKMTVMHTYPPKRTVLDIIDKDLAAADGESSFTSSANKFLNTDLEKSLKSKGMKTIIIVGTAAHGAVLYTGSTAAELGFDVIVPTDCISSTDSYAEQVTTWLLANGVGGIAERVTLTRSDTIKIK